MTERPTTSHGRLGYTHPGAFTSAGPKLGQPDNQPLNGPATPPPGQSQSSGTTGTTGTTTLPPPQPPSGVRLSMPRVGSTPRVRDLDQAREVIAAYIDRYHDRPDSRLNYRTPCEVRATWDDAHGALPPSWPELSTPTGSVPASSSGQDAVPDTFWGLASAAPASSVPRMARQPTSGMAHPHDPACSRPTCSHCGERIHLFEVLWRELESGTIRVTYAVDLDHLRHQPPRLWHLGCLPQDCQLLLAA